MAEKLGDTLLASYVDAVDDCSVEAVKRACQRISSGRAGLNTSFPPTPADIAERAALIDESLKPDVGLFNGLIEMDYGHGRIDMRGLTTAEQDHAMRLHGVINGANLATMSLEQKREAIRASMKALPPPRKGDGAALLEDIVSSLQSKGKRVVG